MPNAITSSIGAIRNSLAANEKPDLKKYGLFGGLFYKIAKNSLPTQQPTHQPPITPPQTNTQQPVMAGFQPQATRPGFNFPQQDLFMDMMQTDNNPFKIRRPQSFQMNQFSPFRMGGWR